IAEGGHHGGPLEQGKGSVLRARHVRRSRLHVLVHHRAVAQDRTCPVHHRLPQAWAAKHSSSSAASCGEISPSLTAHLPGGNGNRRRPVSPREREKSRS